MKYNTTSAAKEINKIRFTITHISDVMSYFTPIRINKVKIQEYTPLISPRSKSNNKQDEDQVKSGRR